ncbi:MAG: class I SAM-dependent methyltransferase [Acidobacteriota bacterium]
MGSNSAHYHLAEHALTQTPGDQRQALPEIPAGARSILDIGCGAGQTLLACAQADRKSFGVDYDFEALQLAHSLRVPGCFSRASGEQLPFRSASFDFVYSRVALPYMKIPVALAEIARVLQPGGQVWFTLHPLTMLSWADALSRPRKTVFEAYRLVNTAALHFGASQIRYPLRRSRTESYQTERGMRQALRNSGFEDVKIRRTAVHFVVTARLKAC